MMSGGGTCNVLESDTSYEANKENDGAPMDIWRLDFSVRNGSGRWLDHLIARYQIDSEWPDCTNWDGPGAGEFQPLEWTDLGDFIQQSGRNVVAPGQTLTQTKFFIVRRGDPEPRFSNWSMDFDFAVNPPTGVATAAGAAGSPPTAAVADQLPPDIQADRYLRQTEQAVRDGDSATALAAMERLEALQQEYRLEPPPEDHYRYAQAWEAAGEPERAMAAAVDYLQLQGRDAEHYTEALDLMNRAETTEAAVVDAGAGVGRTEPAQPFRPGANEPICAGQEDITPCWTELDSHPGCYVFSAALNWPDWTATWSAGCTDGLASGSGTLKFVSDNNWDKLTGLLRAGKQQGHWVVRYANENVGEGPFVDGLQHGRWVRRYADGSVWEGPYVDGKWHGQWILRHANGTVVVERYVNGEPVN